MRSFLRSIMAFLVVITLTASFAAAAELSQTQRLAGLCRVWGMLKYYHNAVAAGPDDWNLELLTAIPKIKAARDSGTYEHELLQLIRKAGYGETSWFAAPECDLVNIDWRWLDQMPYSTPLLSFVLKAVRDGHNPTLRYYYGPVFDKGNLEFLVDAQQTTASWQREEVRLLALFCYWNIIEYFFPYKHLMDRPWEETLLDFIPLFSEAPDELSYHLAVMELGARLNDGHGQVYSSILSAYMLGSYTVGFDFSFVEGRTVVTWVYPSLLGGCDIRVGDIITHINGRSCEALRAEKRKYVYASNEPTLQRNLNSFLFPGQSSLFDLIVERGGQSLPIRVPGVAYSATSAERQAVENTIVSARILEGRIGYIHMGALKMEQVDAAMAMMKNTPAIIFDVRNYPKEPVIYTICNYLNETSRPWAKFHYPLLGAPGYFGSEPTFTAPSNRNPDYYKGSIIILANESTQSHAEYVCMALQATGRSTLVGSQTAGADGNISYVYLPGGITALFTGLGCYYPDGRQTQRIGIVPNIEVRPTIAGICAGRDEVLERALQFVATGK